MTQYSKFPKIASNSVGLVVKLFEDFVEVKYIFRNFSTCLADRYKLARYYFLWSLWEIYGLKFGHLGTSRLGFPYIQDRAAFFQATPAQWRHRSARKFSLVPWYCATRIWLKRLHGKLCTMYVHNMLAGFFNCLQFLMYYCTYKYSMYTGKV